MSNYVAVRVVAVPVCRPARPARAHPSLVAPFADRNISFAHGYASFAGGNATFADGNVLLWYGNAAARTFGRAHRHRPYHSNTHRHSEKVEIKILMLAITLQALKRKNIVPAPRGDDKIAQILFPRCTVTIKWHKYCFRAAQRR